jgi:hypothetical protein
MKRKSLGASQEGEARAVGAGNESHEKGSEEEKGSALRWVFILILGLIIVAALFLVGIPIVLRRGS